MTRIINKNQRMKEVNLLLLKKLSSLLIMSLLDYHIVRLLKYLEILIIIKRKNLNIYWMNGDVIFKVNMKDF